MKYDFSKSAQKQIAKLDNKLKSQLVLRLKMLEQVPPPEILRLHNLKGEYLGYSSVNITGDFRLIFRQITSDTIFILAVGTHSQLYR
jgi:addiction module RelE/StbE family toxin